MFLTACVLSVSTQSRRTHPCLQCSGSSLRLADSRCFSSVSPLAIIIAARVTAAVPCVNRNTAHTIRRSWLFLSILRHTQLNQRVDTQDGFKPAATSMCHARQAALHAVNRSKAGNDSAGHTGMHAGSIYAARHATHFCPWPDQLSDVSLIVLKLREVVASRQRPTRGL